MADTNDSTSSIEQSAPDNKSYVIEEYKEVGNNMRHFSNMRVAVLTIQLAINGVLLEKFASIDNLFLKFSISTLGVITSVVFFIFEIRVTIYYLHYQSRAKELETQIQFSQYLIKPPSSKINATLVTRILYWTFILIWLLWSLKEVINRQC